MMALLQVLKKSQVVLSSKCIGRNHDMWNYKGTGFGFIHKNGIYIYAPQVRTHTYIHINGTSSGPAG